jgi:hypothetical protein
MTRITRKMLESRVETINSILNCNPAPYTRSEDGKLAANVGTFYLSGAYGGYCVNRMANDSGGVSMPIWNGHIPARDAYERISAFIAGIQFGK